MKLSVDLLEDFWKLELILRWEAIWGGVLVRGDQSLMDEKREEVGDECSRSLDLTQCAAPKPHILIQHSYQPQSNRGDATENNSQSP